MTKQTKNIGLVIGLVAIVVLLTAVVVVNVQRNSSSRDMRAELQNELDNCDSANCRDRVADRWGGLIDGNQACRGLDGDDLRDCAVARALDMDTSACALLPVDQRDPCFDRGAVSEAVQNTDVAACSDIQGEDIRSTCYLRIATSGDLSADACSDLPSEYIDYCLLPLDIEEALATQNPDICETYRGGANVEECEDVLFSIDEDRDGLPLGLEFLYATSDTNPDTDSDGFDDFTEVENGFNPLGE
jgi:hypothetical protein